MQQLKIMKFNKISLYVAGVLSFAGASCTDSYLDKEVDLTLQPDMVFEDYDMTRGALAALYNYLPDAFAGYSDTQFRLNEDCMTDNCIDYWGVARYHSVMDDAYDSDSHWFASDLWNNYRGIRACNQFLKNARPGVIGNAEKKGDDNKLYDRWMAEARFMRAILHFEMMSYYGGIPIVGDETPGDLSTAIVLAPGGAIPERGSIGECLDWIISEMDAIKDALPFRYSNEDENWGRANGAACYALRARAALYKASPLNNTTNDKALWETAARYAEDFMAKNTAANTAGKPYMLHTTAGNDPNQNYYDVFTTNPVRSNEYILSRSVWNTLNLVHFNGPCGFSGNISNTGYANPTQNLVDAYETINGLPIDQDPTYDDQNPYKNRDPRLAQTIFHHGMLWGMGDEERPLDMNNDDTRVGIDYARGNGGTCTGYYLKKYVHNIRFDGTSGNQQVACPIFRYAEILLNAAEAYAEAGNAGKATGYVNQVRARVGMPALPASLSKDQLIERIHNERRIELCFEDHRWIDCRRWKLFDGQTKASEVNLPRYKQLYNLYGVAIREGSGTTFNYGLSEKYSTQTFNAPKNYRFPIPYSEVQRISNMKQNPGWER